MRPPRTRPCRCRAARIVLPLTVLLLATLALACGIGSGSKPSRSFQPFPNDTATPPDSLPLDLDAADKLRHDGDIETALAIYQAVAQRRAPSDPEWVRAVRSAAHTYFQEGDFDLSAGVAAVLLDADPPPEERRRALLLLGAAQQEGGDAEAAAQALQEYVDEGGVATPHARVRLASALSAQGDNAAAIEQLEMALAEGLPAAGAVDALFALARAYEAEDRAEEALSIWERAAEEAQTAADRGEALWFLAQAAGQAGEDRRYQTALVTLARDYPWHERALEAITQAQRVPSPALSEVERGVVLFNQGRTEAAEETFRDALAEDDSITAVEQGRAHFFLALLSERAGQPDEALIEYNAALEALSGLESEPLYGEVAWERAVLLEAMERIEEAVTGYVALADASPDSDRAPEASFRAGLVRLRQGIPGDAASFWSRYLEMAEGEDIARAHFWLATANMALGDASTANAHLEQATEAAPWDYFGMRAAALMDNGEPLPLDEPAPELAERDWSAVESWLASWAGPEDPDASPDLARLPAWQRAVELLQAGLDDEAEEHFRALLTEFTGEPWPLFRLAQRLYQEDQTPLAARAAARLVGERDAPRDILSVAYPSEYIDLAEAEARENGFPPLLMLALVRQESFFEPDAQSSAGALGLTQVIPSTAEAIAEQLSEDDFTFGQLRRPTVSLRFGARYLGEQLDRFDGDIPAALAAYNGGPGNSLQWYEIAPDDPDLFLETIWFSETRAYVELVLEHYARYRFAYGLADGPALPL